MSNQFAIAAVTRTLQSLLKEVEIEVTTKTPDQAAKDTGKRVNLFLYHTMHNAAWRNQDIPGRARKSERGNPPLALNLHYLLTAYGEDGVNLADQELLGSAMLMLHDRPILKQEYIKRSLQGYPVLLDSELADQIDKVRIVPEYLDIENMSRLWTTFQTQYRVSAAYQASVVLIESRRPTTSALPVTRRGAEDQGVVSDVGMPSILTGVEYKGDPLEPRLPAAAVGSTITLLGENLPRVNLTAVFRDPQAEFLDSDESVVARIPVGLSENDRITVDLDEAAGNWLAGTLTVELVQNSEGEERSTNPIPIAIAPKILTSGGDASVVANIDVEDQTRILSINLANPVRENRRALLTLNKFEPDEKAKRSAPIHQFAEKQIDPTSSFALAFDITKVPKGEYWVRIRVDGIESLMMKRDFDANTGKYRVDFDSQQRIRIE